jgi:hypothetical protein
LALLLLFINVKAEAEWMQVVEKVNAAKTPAVWEAVLRSAPKVAPLAGWLESANRAIMACLEARANARSTALP